MSGRRLEAGDWVVARGSATPGLGKLSGGEYGPVDGALVRARVEYAAGVRWLAPGELERVLPGEEAALVELALARELVPAGRAVALREALSAFAAGERPYVRTPGLLDRLWAALEEPGGAPGLVSFFDRGHEALAELRPRARSAPEEHEAAPAPAAPARPAPPPPPPPPWPLASETKEERLAELLERIADHLASAPVPRAKVEVALGLTAAFLASDWTVAGMVRCAQRALGERARWTRGLARRVLVAFPEPPRHDEAGLAAFVGGDGGFERAWERRTLRIRTLLLSPPAMRAHRRFPVPPLAGARDLAAWLGLDLADLEWLADPRLLLARAPVGPLQHYRYHWLRKANGALRLVEAPKELLKATQRKLLHELLAHVPPHAAAHGFRAGRSVVSYAAPHCGQDLVLRLDLRAFFPSIRAARIAATFRELGYPRQVAFLLAALVTTRTPEDVLESGRLGAADVGLLRQRHLPQGAPTSPALANLCAYRLDLRLSAAAAAAGARYTRYADDLAFSGGPSFRRRARRFVALAVRIAADEGFEVNWRKTRWMRRSGRQRLAGLVVNERPRPSRAELELLEATLTNCARHGPEGQNRARLPDWRAHLRGRVAWFEHTDPPRGAKLRALFERIAW